MLVDQYLTNGVEVTFFGRKTKANPMLARLLRQVECPVHGVRIIRLPNHRFRAELTEEIPAGARCRRQDRRPGHDAGDHQRDRRLDSRISGAVALAASPLAVRSRSRIVSRRSGQSSGRISRKSQYVRLLFPAAKTVLLVGRRLDGARMAVWYGFAGQLFVTSEQSARPRKLRDAVGALVRRLFLDLAWRFSRHSGCGSPRIPGRAGRSSARL